MNREKKMLYSQFTRREFLTGLAAIGAGIPLAANARNLINAKESKKREIKICIFSKHLQWLDYKAAFETAAEIGFDGIDLPVRPKGHVLPEKVEEDLPRAVEAAQKAGLEVYMMTTAITDPRDVSTEKILNVANKLRIGYYRMGYIKYDDSIGVARSLEALKPQFRDLAELNKSYNIHGAYQNHSGTRLGGAVWDIWYLIKDLDPRWMGCQYDIRHATVEGGHCWPLGLELLSKHIKITAIKDFKWAKRDGEWHVQNVPLGEGMVDFKKYFKLIKQYKIDEPISVHYEYPIIQKSEQNLSQKERIKKTIAVMKKDVDKLRVMLKNADLL